MRDPEIEAIQLTSKELEAAIYKEKVVKLFHQRAVKNGHIFEVDGRDLGVEIYSFDGFVDSQGKRHDK